MKKAEQPGSGEGEGKREERRRGYATTKSIAKRLGYLRGRIN